MTDTDKQKTPGADGQNSPGADGQETTGATAVKRSKRIANAILIAVGSISLGLGAVGVVLPILPTTPFFILTLGCYTKGSVKFERWFLGTRLYKKYLEPFVKTKAMTNANKIKVLLLVTGLISVPIILVDILPMRIFLGAIILAHYFMFIFKVKSVSKAELNRLLADVKDKEAKAAAEKTDAGSAGNENAEEAKATAEKTDAGSTGNENAYGGSAESEAETENVSREESSGSENTERAKTGADA
jgi:uncharacterized membrane protein YbaN (DUF454 family)